MKQFLSSLLVVAILLAVRGVCTAEQLRYMDGAGNIHFVDSLSDVPGQYRQQVVPPTPTVLYDKKTMAEIQRRKREADAKKLREQKMKEREEARQRRLKEIELRRQEKEERMRRMQKGRLDNLAR